MALSNRVNARGGGEVPQGNYIYKQGRMIVPLDSNFTYTNYTFTPPQYNVNNIFESSTQLNYTVGFGTSSPIDLSNVDTLYFKARCSRYGSQYPMLVVASSKTMIYDNILKEMRLSAVTDDYVVYAVDVSSINSGYVCVLSTNCDCYIDSIWY